MNNDNQDLLLLTEYAQRLTEYNQVLTAYHDSVLQQMNWVHTEMLLKSRASEPEKAAGNRKSRFKLLSGIHHRPRPAYRPNLHVSFILRAFFLLFILDSDLRGYLSLAILVLSYLTGLLDPFFYMFSVIPWPDFSPYPLETLMERVDKATKECREKAEVPADTQPEDPKSEDPPQEAPVNLPSSCDWFYQLFICFFMTMLPFWSPDERRLGLK